MKKESANESNELLERASSFFILAFSAVVAAAVVYALSAALF